MGLTCGFNVSEMPRDVQAQVGTLYLKLNETGAFDPANGTWLPNVMTLPTGIQAKIILSMLPEATVLSSGLWAAFVFHSTNCARLCLCSATAADTMAFRF